MIARRSLFALPLLAVAACQGEVERDGAKYLREGRRTTVQPLAAAFPALGEPVSAVWFHGGLGEPSRAPGPTDYWTDAVVTVTPETMAELRALGDQQPGAAPVVWRDLRSDLPSSLVTSPELTAAFTGSSPRAQAWLSADTDQVVVTDSDA